VKVILGLGNPGREYEATRHNVGWWVLDHLADVWRLGAWRAGADALAADGVVAGHTVRLVKPQAYYNLSGQALRPFLKRPFWAPQTDLLVVCDDVALPVGTFRLRPQGSAGGSNGLKSIERTLGHQQYPRLRVGTHPAGEGREVGSLVDFVLSPFDPVERAEVLDLFPPRGRRLRGVAARGGGRGDEQAQRAGAGEALTRPPHRPAGAAGPRR
jgi:PTH1 family peptidyl-tRNA hydrolase